MATTIGALCLANAVAGAIEVPFPVDSQYTGSATRLYVDGSLQLRFNIDASGAVSLDAVTSSSDPAVTTTVDSWDGAVGFVTDPTFFGSDFTLEIGGNKQVTLDGNDGGVIGLRGQNASRIDGATLPEPSIEVLEITLTEGDLRLAFTALDYGNAGNAQGFLPDMLVSDHDSVEAFRDLPMSAGSFLLEGMTIESTGGALQLQQPTDGDTGFGLRGLAFDLISTPTVSRIIPVSDSEIRIIFDRPLEQSSAETASNYSFEDGIAVFGAALIAPDTVALTLDQLVRGTTYTLGISGVRSTGGYPIAEPTTLSFYQIVPRDPLPNVVVIIADDLGYSDISHNPYSPPEVSTPHIDRLIDSGVWFSNAYATANICGPSRSGFLTGQLQQRLGFHLEQDVNWAGGIPASVPNFAEQLKQPGDNAEDYACIMIGKWHNGRNQSVTVSVDGNNDGDFNDFGSNNDPLDDYGDLVDPASATAHPMNRGFDEVYGFLNLGGQSYWNYEEGFYEDFYRHDSQTPIDGIADGDSVDTYLTTRFTDEACDFITRQAAEERPFYVHLAYSAVHGPYEAPSSPEGLSEGDPGWFPGPQWFYENYPDMWQSPTDQSSGSIDTQAKRDAVRLRRAEYIALLYHLDEGVGRVVETLRSEGVLDNTIVIFWSDNGGIANKHASNAPLRGRKQFNYEGGIRVPMSMTWPAGIGQESGRTIDAVVSSVDILPTVLDAAGILPVHGFEAFDGKSWLPLIKGEVDNLHEALFWSEGQNGEYAVRAGDWKLYVRRNDYELYNLAEDLGETTNLATSHPHKLRELRQRLFNWMEAVTAESGDDLSTRFWAYGNTSTPDGSFPIEYQGIRANGDTVALEFDLREGWLSEGAVIEATDSLVAPDWQPVSPSQLRLIDRFLDWGTYEAELPVDGPHRFFRISDGE